MKYRVLLPQLVLAPAGRDDMLIGLDPAAGDSGWQPIVDSCTIACGDLPRDRLDFVDGTCREARPVLNSRLDPEATVPAVDRVYPLHGAARFETPCLDEQGWLWFPGLEPFSAGADARPHRSGTGTGAGARLANTPHAGCLEPPGVDEPWLPCILRPGDTGYLQLSRAYRIEVLM